MANLRGRAFQACGRGQTEKWQEVAALRQQVGSPAGRKFGTAALAEWCGFGSFSARKRAGDSGLKEIVAGGKSCGGCWREPGQTGN
jgi:hypothetical protein